jgi:hypothetical protein
MKRIRSSILAATMILLPATAGGTGGVPNTLNLSPVGNERFYYYFRTASPIQLYSRRLSSGAGDPAEYREFAFVIQSENTSDVHTILYREYPNFPRADVLHDLLIPMSAIPEKLTRQTTRGVIFYVACQNQALRWAGPPNYYYYSFSNIPQSHQAPEGGESTCRFIYIYGV